MSTEDIRYTFLSPRHGLRIVISNVGHFRDTLATRAVTVQLYLNFLTSCLNGTNIKDTCVDVSTVTE